MSPSTFLNFEVDYKNPPAPIALAGRGHPGGKARGLLCAAYHRLHAPRWAAMAHRDLVEIPATTVLTTEYFERFLNYNGLTTLYGEVSYDELKRRYLQAPFPAEDRALFRELILRMDYPLAIRSSSLLEDNASYSFAGIYLTLFIPNRGDIESRLVQFETAVKRVFASTYNPNAFAYRSKHGLRGRQEKMAVMVQRLVGTPFDGFFFPAMAGVAFSRNYFPWSPRIRTEDGLVRLVFGLGTRAVGRNYARVFSPGQPNLHPEGSVVPQIVRYSQEVFDALDLDTGGLRSEAIGTAALGHPHLRKLCSVLRDLETLAVPSPAGLDVGDRPIMTFSAILHENRHMPLVPLIRELLAGLEEMFGLAVDVEFACDFETRDAESVGRFYLLQCRPLGARAKDSAVTLPDLSKRTVAFSGGQSLGNGNRESIKHLIYVSPATWREVPAAQIARRIGEITRPLEAERYILAGPGRWGSNNPELGIPVTYGEIANATVLVEIAAENTTPELSYGTHFFGDLLADDSFYLPIFPERGDFANHEWIMAQPNAVEGRQVRLVSLRDGFTATFDGRSRAAAIYL